MLKLPKITTGNTEIDLLTSSSISIIPATNPVISNQEYISVEVGSSMEEEWDIVGAQEKDSLKTFSWRNYLNPTRLLEAWSPPQGSPYFFKDKLINSVEGIKGIQPRYSEGEERSIIGIRNLIESGTVGKNTAVILDSGGAHSVAMAIELMKQGYQPIVMFNNIPYFKGAVNSQQNLATLLYFAGEAEELKEKAKFNKDSPPVFILDAHRDTLLIGKEVINNTYHFDIEDFPSGEELRRFEITKVVYLNEGDQDGEIRHSFQSIDRLSDDLKPIVTKWESFGIQILYTGVAPWRDIFNTWRINLLQSKRNLKDHMPYYGEQDKKDTLLDMLDKLCNDKNFSSSSLSLMETRDQFGGIDFRFLPIVTQAITNLNGNISSSAINRLSNANLDIEWQGIERMAGSGIRVSSERIKEYVQAGCVKGNIIQIRDKIILYISDMLRQEEDLCVETDSTLRDILVVLESIRDSRKLKEVFLGEAIPVKG